MRMLVTGSSGLIGSEVAAYFAAAGWEVHGLDNNQRAVFFGPEGDTPICSAFRFEAPNTDAVIAQVRPPVPPLTETVRVAMTLMGGEPHLYLPAPADTLALATTPVSETFT